MVTGDPALARHPGEDVGPYAIDVDGMSGMSAANYDFDAGGRRAPSRSPRRPCTVTAADDGKVYGDADAAASPTR